MNYANVLVIVLIIAILVSVPRWGWSQTWGSGPVSAFIALLVVLLLLRLLGLV